jgi:hypothetical protein
MSAEILTDAALWLAQFDLRRSMNTIAMQADLETEDVTCFGDGARAYAVGLPRISFSAGGFPIDEPTDAALFGLMGQKDLPLTVGKTRTEGAVAYVGSILDSQYTSLLSVSQARRFATTGELCTRSFGRGRILTIGSALATTANGTGIQLRAITINKKAFATLHVTAVTGTLPTMDVIIQSDDNVGFTTPTTRATFTQKIAVGSQIVNIDGPITDDYWRARYTIGGTSPAFTFAVAIGFEETV